MKHFVLDHSGHSTVEYDEADPVMLEAANQKFMELVGDQKKVAATRKAGETDYKVIKDPSQQKDETLFATPYQGG